ncbi:NUDIX domain-containing protein [Leucobacter tardus]|uniref:NUDIX hydrolase n=1 Tax=Leucobacter tardus TaxID=501483 RepID=A0A939QMM8_9MICO|nr:NUDIX domain-containing protein [Leucobacter tardus]MBO2990711.1 NUDIX hydrolase [Leucobacter tardus]
MDYSRLSASERRTAPPAIAVSAVAFALGAPEGAELGDSGDTGPAGGGAGAGATDAGEAAEGTPWLPLVRRTREPFAGVWALPGGPIPWDETLAESAERTLRATVGASPGYLEQLYAFGDVERSGRGQRLVTIAYWALYGENDLVAPADPPVEPENIAWFSADRLPELAFDHADIVEYALWRLRMKTEYAAVAHRFLGGTFTLAQLRRVHEAILGTEVDPANFRRQALAQGHLVDTGDVETGTRHRPAKLYRFRER